MLYVPANETREGKYIKQIDSRPLLSCIYFSERDEIHVKRIHTIPIIKEGSETTNEKIDLDQSVAFFFDDLCKKYFLTSQQWEICKIVEDKETGLESFFYQS